MASAMDATPAATEVVGQSSSSAALGQQSSELLIQDARFSCNICFDAVSEPVVTRCGHLYCWPCLFRWLAPGMTRSERASLGMPRLLTPLDEARRCCPVCKAECSVPTVVPIYVRGGGSGDNNIKAEARPSASSRPDSGAAGPQGIPHATSDLSSNMGLDIDGDGDLGLDIDDNHHHPPQHHNQRQPAIPTTVTTDNHGTGLGLRQRRRSDSTNRDELLLSVPTRPVPSRDRTTTSDTNISSNAANNSTALVRAHEDHLGHTRATLSSGLVLAMHQTLLQATNSNTISDGGSSDAAEAVPSLHYPERRNSYVADESAEWDQDPASTLFLSRLLLGLSLFVLFCLLSF